MAEFKNQHFVPRCHLENFSSDSNGPKNRICIFNIKRDKLIIDASIRNQCSDDYFYGDKFEEQKFHQFESWYAEALKEILRGNMSVAAGEKLRAFLIIQHARTEGAAKTLSTYSAMYREAIDPERRDFPTGEGWDVKTALKESLATAAYIHKFFYDLKWAIVINKSRVPFITSDDPVLWTNRYAWQRLRVRRFGAISSGLTVSMPLSPGHWIIFYDSLVYKMESEAGRIVTIQNDADARTLNDLQCIKALHNLYCADRNNETNICQSLHAVEKIRQEERFELQQYRRENEETDSYNLSNNPNVYDGAEYITNAAPIYPVPPNWFPKLKIRLRPRFYTTGSLVRHVRNPDWLNSDRMEKWRTR